ncbi:zinc finger protein 91-like isoform X2 [Drosophila sulfurigaster albostrigata]|uniref:zinc finger protein 91-like isoform X2 n=1 Tax=Drosophila sulfurigaster albostrigata TaxID=89887 RepID=UPI002D21A8EE|nr:zinc finger protein 91-like isoform X2 [Drosophila sulfurigaster albostrigata]
MSAILDISCIKEEPRREEETEPNYGIEIDIGPVKIETGTSKEVLSTAKRKPNQCPHCPRFFEMRAELEIHLQIHTSNLLYKCSYCPNSFSHKSVYTMHMFGHTGEFPYQCPQCESGFIRQQEFKKHMQMHKRKSRLQAPPSPVKKAPFKQVPSTKKLNFTLKCPHCPLSLKNNEELAKHLQIHGDGRIRKESYLWRNSLHCPHCPRDCMSSQELSQHLQTHRQRGHNKTLQCTRCPRSFKSSDELAIHLQIHSDRLSHKCPYCPSSFSHKTIYLAHLCEHTGAFPYKCYKCTQGFMKKYELKKHSMSHYEVTNNERQINDPCIKMRQSNQELEKRMLEMEDQKKRKTENQELGRKSNYRNKLQNKSELIDLRFIKKEQIEEDTPFKAAENKEKQAEAMEGVTKDKVQSALKHDETKKQLGNQADGSEQLTEDPLKEESGKDEPLREVPCKEEPLEEDCLSEDPLKEETWQELPLKEEPMKPQLSKQELEKEASIQKAPGEQTLRQHENRQMRRRPYKCELCSMSFTQLNNLNVHRRKHSKNKIQV